MKLVVIDACVRGPQSRTWRVAREVIEALSHRYEVVQFHLPAMKMEPLSPSALSDRNLCGVVPQWARDAATQIASADRILVAAPFWDMSFPSCLKVFIEHTSLLGITFDTDDRKCYGLCRCTKLLYITTRGMDIPTGDPLDGGTSYLRALSQLWGLGEVEVLSCRNMDYSTPAQIEGKIQEAVLKGREIAKTF